jgi:tetraprenyl-beta-curcumene synthase
VGSAIREVGAAASALGAYLTTVLPRARRELKRLGPLPEEKTENAEAVAVFATLAPHRSRATAVRAIVALQVAIDLRDEIEEAGQSPGPAETTARIEGLERAWRQEVASLPAHETVLPQLERAVERCHAGQLHTHLAAELGPAPLERWAQDLEAPPDYRWWEVAAGASSSVAAHALIAAAAEPRTTAAEAELIDAAYFPPIGALTVLLDDLVDRDEDRDAGAHNYLSYYEDSEDAATRLDLVTQLARTGLTGLHRRDRHTAILAGVAGFYLSAAEAETPYARPIRDRLLRSTGPAVRPIVSFMRRRRR